MNCRPFLLYLALLMTATSATALESDRNQPIAIEADRVTIDDLKGVSTYHGRVKLTQGSLEVKAELIRVEKPGEQVEYVDSSGKPVHFRQQGDIPKESIRGYANRVEYNLKEGIITLTGDAHLWQEQDEFSGEEIIYNFTTRRVKASSGEGTGRVRVILQPREESKP